MLKERINVLCESNQFRFIEFPDTAKIRNKLDFMFVALKRNMLGIRYLGALKEKYDIVYSVSSVLDMILLPFLLKKNDKQVRWVTIFDNIVPLSDPGNRFFRFLAWFFFRVSLVFLKEADAICAISGELKRFLIENGFDESKITVTGNGVETDLIEKVERPAQCDIDALFIGRINETKGIYEMLKILALVKKQIPDFHLAIMGAGDATTEREFRRAIRDAGLERNIQFLGYKSGEEKFRIIKSSKCFWFFSVSDSESFGVALLEAVCSGVPAFAYDLLPFRDIYRNGEVTLVKIYDCVSAAEKIISLFNKGDFSNKRGEMLLFRYQWDIIAETEYVVFNRV
ncbi:MAG: glycosyltransferase [Candidatus Omnitrophica bacterium]|nr:glycosyltransferase [Candidatus Omnitrophota bacterium]